MRLERQSPCKVNLLLNILGKRPDGFHELETVMHPVNICDELTFEKSGAGLLLTCNNPELPCDTGNLVYRAAAAFLNAAGIKDGIKIHLQKKLPLAGGIGGGSANAAVTLSALNELFGLPLSTERLHELAAALGSDVPFFLYDRPALATGRGEQVRVLAPFKVLSGRAFFLYHPGFGISTPWAYQNLARFPEALNGQPGRAARLIDRLQIGDWEAATADFYNSLEAPALDKYPILNIYQEYLQAHGALTTLMSGSGSTTFAIMKDLAAAEGLAEQFMTKFGRQGWLAAVAIP